METTERRTRKDCAEQMKRPAEEDSLPEKIVLAMDNLNARRVASPYETFPAEEAKRLPDKLGIHYTPKHGSWLNMAEIELNVINDHGFSKRILTLERMRKEAKAWNRMRAKEACKINRRFTTENARINPKRLYLQFE